MDGDTDGGMNGSGMVRVVAVRGCVLLASVCVSCVPFVCVLLCVDVSCVLLCAMCLCVSVCVCAMLCYVCAAMLLCDSFFLALLTKPRSALRLAGPSCAGPAQGLCRTFYIPHTEF